MADGSYTAQSFGSGFGSDTPMNALGSLVSGLKKFAAAHSGATAVIEYAGRRGARIVLSGQDGTGGVDHFAESTEAARAACAKAGVNVENEWEKELVEQMRPANDLWRSMGRRVFSR